jgi:hypothetical protein
MTLNFRRARSYLFSAAVLALLGIVSGVVFGLTRHSTPAVRAPYAAARPSTVSGCVASWNDRNNGDTRQQIRPGSEPFGPLPITDIGGQPTTSLDGPHKVHVGVSQSFGSEFAAGHAGRCYVYLFFPNGYKDGPALLSLPLADTATAFPAELATVTVGKDTDVSSAPTAGQNPDGTLVLTGPS